MLKGNSQKGRWEYRLKRNRTWSQGPHGPQKKEDGKIDPGEIEDKTRVLMDLRSLNLLGGITLRRKMML